MLLHYPLAALGCSFGARLPGPTLLRRTGAVVQRLLPAPVGDESCLMGVACRATDVRRTGDAVVAAGPLLQRCQRGSVSSTLSVFSPSGFLFCSAPRLIDPPPHLQPSTLVPTSSSEYRFWPPATPSPRNWRTLRRRVNHQACSWCSSTTTVRSRALLAWGLGIASSLCVLLIDLCVRPAVVLAG